MNLRVIGNRGKNLGRDAKSRKWIKITAHGKKFKIMVLTRLP